MTTTQPPTTAPLGLSHRAPAPRAAPPILDSRTLKAIVTINGIVPLAILSWDYSHNQLGADPAHYALLTTGLLAIIFLMLTLLITPLRALTHWNTLIAARRALGLYAFFYACIHVSIYFATDPAVDRTLPKFFHEIYTRFYLLIGITALTLMAPLALTSTNAMIKLLGGARWQLLHRAIYFVAILAIIHYCMQSKLVSTQQYLFIAALVALLLYRFIAKFLQLPRTANLPIRTSPATGTTESPTPSPTDLSRRATAPARWSGQLRVHSITPETPDVRTFRLTTLDNSPLLFTPLPGQYLTLTLHINGQEGGATRRNYTIASSNPTHVEVTIKRDPTGTASRHLHDSVKVGDLLTLAAPSGSFTFTPNRATAFPGGAAARASPSDSIALLAAGVGITPLMAILRHLTSTHWPGQIHLLYSSKTESDIIFRQELQTLQKSHPNLHITLTLTRPAPTWPGPVGRINSALLTQSIPHLTTIPIYLCGPTEMIRATQQLLADLHVPAQHIHTESFGTRPPERESPDSPLSAATAQQFTITFARSQKSITTTHHSPLLEVAEQLGINHPSDCRSGICGTCKCPLLSGSVHMPTQEALTPTDQQNRIILLCQSHPLEDVTLDA